MARYKYITKIEVVESDDPQLEKGKIFWMLGKRIDKQFHRIDHENKGFFYAKVRPIQISHLPYSMNKEEAWAYFDEHIKPKELKAIA